VVRASPKDDDLTDHAERREYHPRPQQRIDPRLTWGATDGRHAGPTSHVLKLGSSISGRAQVPSAFISQTLVASAFGRVRVRVPRGASRLRVKGSIRWTDGRSEGLTAARVK
jgi:hypothetical protein